MSTVEEIRSEYGDEIASAIKKHLEWLNKLGLVWKFDIKFTENNVVIGVIDETFLELFIVSKTTKKLTGRIRLKRSELEDVIFRMNLIREVSKWPA